MLGRFRTSCLGNHSHGIFEKRSVSSVARSNSRRLVSQNPASDLEVPLLSRRVVFSLLPCASNAESHPTLVSPCGRQLNALPLGERCIVQHRYHTMRPCTPHN